MSNYLLINIFIIIIPLIFSFENKIRFYKKTAVIGTTIIMVGIPFIIWDSIAVRRGDWSFNEEYLTGIKLFNLPLEEIFFFITVPYSTLFIYETLNFYLKDKNIFYNKFIYIIIFLFSLIISFIFFFQYYTATIFVFFAVYIILASSFYKNILSSKNYWIFILLTYKPFFIVNYLLTSMPIVLYNPESIWGIKILTIPLEDFIYSFTLISFYLMVYKILVNEWEKRKKLQ
jgi:lycopene cyclase domain-containing protein